MVVNGVNLEKEVQCHDDDDSFAADPDLVGLGVDGVEVAHAQGGLHVQLPLILLTGKHLPTLLNSRLVRPLTKVWFASARSMGTTSSLVELVPLFSSLER